MTQTKLIAARTARLELLVIDEQHGWFHIRDMVWGVEWSKIYQTRAKAEAALQDWEHLKELTPRADDEEV